MSLVLVIGESGTGKSTAIRTLNAEETLLIQIIEKPLPFRGGNKKYYQDKDYCNKLICEDWNKIYKYLEAADEKKKFKNIIIDDFQYLMANEYMNRAEETGWDKFTKIAYHAWAVIDKSSKISPNINIFFLSHSQTDDFGKSKCKTIGKLLDEKITIEGIFTIVLHSKIINGDYVFLTQNDGTSTSKSPMDMFKDKYIPNDLQAVADRIEEYYNEDIDM